jgi:ribulose-5-phosphate 4-epimerase/fuculose-1-phosphate aldolase
MANAIKTELSLLCQKVGTQIPLWTQGAGGNISIKDQDTLWIKATGYRLDAVRETGGLAQVDFRKMAEVLESADWNEVESEQKYSDLIQETTLRGPGLGRASMETGFHARLSQKFVLHFHSLASLLLCHERRKDKLRVNAWLKKKTKLEVIFVEPCRPGWILSKKVFGHTSIYFLESHGIILQGQDEKILDVWMVLEQEFCSEFNYPELLEFLSGKTSFGELFEKFSGQAIPFKCYFPDVAVFNDRLFRVLERNHQGFYLFPKTAITVDRDMAELWLATLMIYHFCPEFEEVPEEIANTVKELPTEKIRQQIKGKNG